MEVLNPKSESLPSMVSGVWSDNNNLQLEATTQFRKLLSIERSPPIEEFIQSGVVPRFVEFLMREDFPQLQWQQMDIEYTFWQMLNLCTSPKVVYQHTKYHKQTKNQWARDDPAFVVICSLLLAVATMAYCAA